MSATTTRKPRRAAKSAKPKVDIYKLVTDRIVAALDAGVVPWHQPWRNLGVDGAPRSLSTGKTYRGINVFILSATAQALGYTSRWWGTYKQIAERGGQVRAGETGTPIVVYRFVGEERDAAGNITKRGIPFLRYFTVFNANQCDGLDVDEPVATTPEHDPIESCEEVSNGYRLRGGPPLQHGGDKAYYRPFTDTVTMPLLAQFESARTYYATLFHEFAHSTGHESRLKRSTLVEPAPFGSEDYSREELVAEMTSAFVCGNVGIDVDVPQSAAYIANWREKLVDDPKAVVQAAAAAQKAADLILGVTYEAEAKS